MRVVIFGNSGAGKSTLAVYLAKTHDLDHLDLDTLAWEPDPPPTRRPLGDSAKDIESFMVAHDAWVVEGCYSDLLGVALSGCTRLVFLNPGVDTCVRNCRARPWEPHKYETREAQDANLAMLIEWVRAYDTREDVFSLHSHRELFEGFDGEKIELTRNTSLVDEGLRGHVDDVTT